MEKQTTYLAVGLLAGFVLALFVYFVVFPGFMMGYGYGMPMMG